MNYLIGKFKHLDTSMVSEVYFKEGQDIPYIEGYQLQSVRVMKGATIMSNTIQAGAITDHHTENGKSTWEKSHWNNGGTHI